MYDYYLGKTVDELLAMRAAVQNRDTTGVIGLSSAAGIQQQRVWTGAGDVAVTLRRINDSLTMRDPVTYPDARAGRVRKTRTRYTYS